MKSYDHKFAFPRTKSYIPERDRIVFCKHPDCLRDLNYRGKVHSQNGYCRKCSAEMNKPKPIRGDKINHGTKWSWVSLR